jgi:hypothetical protein
LTPPSEISPSKKSGSGIDRLEKRIVVNGEPAQALLVVMHFAARI